MPGNRTILSGTALFLVVIIFIISSPGKSSRGGGGSNQDFTIIIPEPQYNAPQGGSIHEDVAERANLTDQQQQQALSDIIAQEHITLSAISTTNKKWFPLDFNGVRTYNPNLLPHPHPMRRHLTIMIAQVVQQADDTVKTTFLQEIACPAEFKNNTMRCAEPPVVLSVAPSASTKCNKKLEPFNYIVGGHDARAFYGPERPYLMYGAPSAYTCLGMWMQELSRLYPWNYQEPLKRTDPFFLPTDLQRPPPYAVLEKNWFAFWDRAGEMYLHYDMAPRRAFAKVNATGGVGPDLAPQVYESDEQCMQKLMPKITHPGYEHIHQSTNSLMITLCARGDDPTCFETEQNTFIMSIIHLKAQLGHDVYEPYVVLFKRTAPFELHAIGKKPLWINGRDKPNGTGKQSKNALFYITSMAWKEFGKSYHGYLNNELFLNFGIEDQASGAIDIMAGDLIQDMGLCG